MQKYKYKAVDMNHKSYSGTYYAKDENDLRAQLAEQQLYLTSFSVKNNDGINTFFTFSGKVKTREITLFCRQFSNMINAGISIVDCIGVLKTQPYSSLFKKVLNTVYEDLHSGLMLSEAFGKHPKIFPNFFRSMVHVGEMSGSLDECLVNLADYYELNDKIKRQLKSALVYPIMLVVMLVAVLALMFVYVIPTFRESLNNLDVEMPAITKFVYGVSDFVVNNYLYIILAVVGVVLLFMLIKRNPKGRYGLDYLKYNLPIFKKVNVNLVTSRFAHGFGLLMKSGMNLVDSMEIMCDVLGNKFCEARFRKAIDEVRSGVSLTLALKKNKIFPDMLEQMVAIGEETGSIDNVLLRSCAYFDEQVENTLTGLTTILQPLILVIMGGTIGFVFIAIYSPMLSIMQTL